MQPFTTRVPDVSPAADDERIFYEIVKTNNSAASKEDSKRYSHMYLFGRVSAEISNRIRN